MSTSPSKSELKEPSYQRLTRRRIYLHRLVGDEVLAAKMKTTRQMPRHVVIRFILYAFIATYVILARASVPTLSDINRSIEQRYSAQAFTNVPRTKLFKDVKRVRDVQDWLRATFLLASSRAKFGSVANILVRNRMLPSSGICAEWGSFTLTLRRVSLTDDYVSSTTDRFRQLYAWSFKVPAISPGQAVGPGEETGPIQAGGTNLTWLHSRQSGFQRQGGYVAVIAVHPSGVYVHLVADPPQSEDDVTRTTTPDPDIGICGEMSRSATLSLEDFLYTTGFDAQFSNVVVETTAYNANVQALTRLLISFEAGCEGMIRGQNINTETIRLDTANNFISVMEIAYLVLTCGYFFEWLYRVWKYFPGYFKDVWCWINLCSIISSLMSLLLWYAYTSSLAAFSGEGAQRFFADPTELEARINLFKNYCRASSFATLTIYLRVLQLMANTKARIKLLLRTLGLSAGNLAIYFCYILVLFWGFAACAQTSFSALSLDFITPQRTFFSCLDLFVGSNSSMKGFESPLKLPFYVLFTVIFFFISVQMFNAIVNYAYNRVSEEMEPAFERERNEQKRRELKMKLSGKKSRLHQLSEQFMRWVKQDQDDEPTPKDDAVGDKKKTEENAPPAFENLDANARAKVENYMNRGKDQQTPDGPCSMIMFVIFACLYISFLIDNLSVTESSNLRHAIDLTLGGVKVPATVIGNETLQFLSLADVQTIKDAKEWITQGLPVALFESISRDTLALAWEKEILAPNQVCIKGWNCLVSLPDRDTCEPDPPSCAGKPKSVRITSRRNNVLANTFGQPDSKLNVTGAGVATALSELSPSRGVMEQINPDAGPSFDENTSMSFNLTYAGETFCRTVPTGSGGYANNGGIVCSLDANYTVFKEQMRLIVGSNMFEPESSSFSVEMVAYNGNRNLLTYIGLHLVVKASGAIETVTQVQSMRLFDIDDFWDNVQPILRRMATGVLYLILVGVFLYSLISSLRAEQFRKRVNENTGPLAAAIEFFTLDLFNTLEAVSIMISLISAALFMNYLGQEGHMLSMMGQGHGPFVEYCRQLASKALLYNRLSALNVLLIFIRPVKFVRGNVRIAKFMETIWGASTDLGWWVVMMFIALAGFVAFAHVSFGPYFFDCSTLSRTLVYCFGYILGNFNFWNLSDADPVQAPIFFFPFVIFFTMVFQNVFFAVIDRNFVTAESPPFNLKRKLKPIFRRICRCIDWDEDHVMQQDPNAEKKQGPPSRRDRVRSTASKIQDIQQNSGDSSMTAIDKRSKQLNEVCDVDERMNDVMFWSREEAEKILETFHKLALKKQEAKHDEVFVKTDVMAQVQMEVKEMRREMEEAQRHMRYAASVHEQMAIRDQETLARYIVLLEHKIQKMMHERHALQMEVHHLRTESDSMRFTKEEMKRKEVTGEVRTDTLQAIADEESEDEGSAGNLDEEGSTHGSIIVNSTLGRAPVSAAGLAPSKLPELSAVDDAHQVGNSLQTGARGETDRGFAPGVDPRAARQQAASAMLDMLALHAVK